MQLYTIYKNPSDFPGKFVVRKSTCVAGDLVPDAEPMAVVEALAAARDQVPPNFCCIPRFEEDDPVIVEVWI